ncbi:MAG: 5-oxoprolinase subunit PxpB [Phycisphaerales bacterium]|nr:5-oxoprolinase subunit PxpB [Planctomycetota bacterium]MCH8508926.1 5-oxoprolinase subunit PxpB [Phycisphaerales bacterium]
MDEVQVIWSSERSVHVVVRGEGNADGIGRVCEALRQRGLSGATDITPGAGSVRIALELGGADPEGVAAEVLRLARAAVDDGDGPGRVDGREVVVPVCYDGAFGPDLAGIADAAGMSREQAAAAHADGSYTVRFLGFTPGFAYMDGLPDALHAARLESPRTRVRAGSVGIAGGRTGIYPRATPGGWRIIGATPLVVFDAERAEPSVFRAGDRVRFRAISRAEFDAIASGRTG